MTRKEQWQTEALAQIQGEPLDWYCPFCKDFFDGDVVTYDERHQVCGAEVTQTDYTDRNVLFKIVKGMDERTLSQYVSHLDPAGMIYEGGVNCDRIILAEVEQIIEAILRAYGLWR